MREVLGDFDNIGKYEKSITRREMLQVFPEENGITQFITYQFIKLPFPITDRELVTLTKVWKNLHGNHDHYMSLEKATQHPKYPIKEKPIRGETIFSGVYLKVKSPEETLMYMANLVDMKFTTGAGFVNKKAPEGTKDFLEEFIKYLGKRSKGEK